MSCNQKENSEGDKIKLQTFKPAKYFFDYDHVDYYYADYGPEKLSESYDKRENSLLDSIQFKVITGSTPENIQDTFFIGKLEKLGYKKTVLDAGKVTELRKYFVEKKVKKISRDACKPVFRDILIFKKRDNITGIAKICFDCNQQRIRGTQLNTDNFGGDGDFESLQKLLR